MTTRKTLRRAHNLALVLTFALFGVPVDANAGGFEIPNPLNPSKKIKLPDPRDIKRPDPRHYGAPDPRDYGLPSPEDIVLPGPDVFSNPGLPPLTAEALIEHSRTAPVGAALAQAIWFSRNRARQSCRPLPRHLAADFYRFFPPEMIQQVCYSTDWGATQNGTLQQLLLGNDQADAIALYDVIVFKDRRLLENRWLWAHEMRHIEQYRVLGLDEFSYQYVRDSDELEGDADDYADHVESYPADGY